MKEQEKNERQEAIRRDRELRNQQLLEVSHRNDIKKFFNLIIVKLSLHFSYFISIFSKINLLVTTIFFLFFFNNIFYQNFVSVA